MFSESKYLHQINKKVLCERKRHTARHAGSANYADLMEVGGTPLRQQDGVPPPPAWTYKNILDLIVEYVFGWNLS